MILDCYQCSSCYFEDKEPSSRINPDTISAPQPRKVFRNVLVAFVCVELYDDRQELKQAAEEFELLSDMIGKRPIVLCPNVHLSIDKAPEKQATWMVTELEKTLTDGFAGLRNCVFPPDILDSSLQFLYKLGHVGFLWDMVQPRRKRARGKRRRHGTE